MLFILLLPTTSFSWFGWGGKNVDLDDLEIEDMPKIVIPGDHGPQKGKVTFTRVGKELFQLFLKQKNYYMSEVNKILNTHEGSKYYHLYSAYCFGFDRWRNTKDAYEQERIKRAVWNIAMEFAQQQKPTLKDRLMQFGPHIVWMTLTIAAFFSGFYLQE